MARSIISGGPSSFRRRRRGEGGQAGLADARLAAKHEHLLERRFDPGAFAGPTHQTRPASLEP